MITVVSLKLYTMWCCENEYICFWWQLCMLFTIWLDLSFKKNNNRMSIFLKRSQVSIHFLLSFFFSQFLGKLITMKALDACKVRVYFRQFVFYIYKLKNKNKNNFSKTKANSFFVFVFDFSKKQNKKENVFFFFFFSVLDILKQFLYIVL